MVTGMHNGASKLMFERAKMLRQNATIAERILWQYLRTNPKGYNFRQQHPYGTYIFDFYCHKLKLVIEVDGSVHGLQSVKRHDLFREKIISSKKMNVLRFGNDEVINRLDAVIAIIESRLV